MGVGMINCIRGLNPSFDFVEMQRHQVKFVAMHIHRRPVDMQTAPLMGATAVNEVAEFFERSESELRRKGFEEGDYYLDRELDSEKMLQVI